MQWEGIEVPELEGFTGFIPPEGQCSLGVAIIGEAPGEQEIRYGHPFYERAPAGSLLTRLLRRAGYERDQFVISNTVWSRPPGNYLDGAHYERTAIDRYQLFRERMFAMFRPRVFIAAGGIALRASSNFGGKGASITSVQGYVLDGPFDGTWTIGILHPAAILRGEQRMCGAAIWAIQRATAIAREGFCRVPGRYLTHPTLDDALRFEAGYSPSQHFLSYDIETANTLPDEEEVEEKGDDISGQITRISLCYDQHGWSISLPWQPPFITVVQRMLASSGPKRCWNSNFDTPRLRAACCPVEGRIYDTMWGWKHLQPTLPRSLGFVAPFYGWSEEPWKHTSDSEPERYSCQDSYALQMIADGVDGHLKQKGMWQIYERHVVDLGATLDHMSRNGLPYSRVRAELFEHDLQAKYDERYVQLQERVPFSLKPSKQKSGLKKEPKDLTGMVQREFPDLDPVTMEIRPVLRWCKLEPFLPTSTQQVQALLKHYNLPIGRNRKTKRDSADDDHLKKLSKKIAPVKKHQEVYELIQMIRECRQLSKVLGTYVKGWRPGPDGRIHSTPGFWGKMFRISWRNPNIAATIQDKQEDYIAQGFRKCVASEPHKVLIEADWRGIEAVLVGWFAGDQDYQRLARLGVHSFMASHLLGRPADLSWGDQSLTSYFKEIKREHRKVYDEAKHCVHGTNYGMGPFLMAEQYEMPVATAKRLQALYFDLFPKVRAWQKSVLDRASRECRLRNPFGYEMPFWEVYRWDSKKDGWVLGEDAKSAIAFLPRDTAAAMLKETILRLKPLAESGVLLACTHDSLTAETLESNVDSVARLLQTEMTRPVPELDHLSIGVEIKAGYCWHEYDEEDCPDGLKPLELLPNAIPVSYPAREETIHVIQ